VDSRGEGPDRLESESRAFHERVRYAFLDLAAADPKRYLVLDAGRPIEEIGDVVAVRVGAMVTSGESAVPTGAPAGVPPDVDLDAPDLAEPATEVSTDGDPRPAAEPAETPVGEIADALGIDDGRAASADGDREPGRRR
jgi:dTMP kinase